ncbi:MAG: hypothetical protein M3094_05325 [Actinomycetia bacterium]|nr:hypothetical protein [Actinomycetes bacterium]
MAVVHICESCKRTEATGVVTIDNQDKPGGAMFHICTLCRPLPSEQGFEFNAYSVGDKGEDE